MRALPGIRVAFSGVPSRSCEREFHSRAREFHSRAREFHSPARGFHSRARTLALLPPEARRRCTRKWTQANAIWTPENVALHSPERVLHSLERKSDSGVCKLDSKPREVAFTRVRRTLRGT